MARPSIDAEGPQTPLGRESRAGRISPRRVPQDRQHYLCVTPVYDSGASQRLTNSGPARPERTQMERHPCARVLMMHVETSAAARARQSDLEIGELCVSWPSATTHQNAQSTSVPNSKPPGDRRDRTPVRRCGAKPWHHASDATFDQMLATRLTVPVGVRPDHPKAPPRWPGPLRRRRASTPYRAHRLAKAWDRACRGKISRSRKEPRITPVSRLVFVHVRQRR